MRRARFTDDADLSGILDTVKGVVSGTTDWKPDWLKNLPPWVIPAAAGFLAGWLIMGRKGGD